MKRIEHVLVALVACYAWSAAAQCNPSGRAAFTAGLEALGSGDLPTAFARFDELVKAQPDCAEARNNLAVVLVEQGKVDAAAEQLRRALELRPDYQRARLNLERLEGMRAGQPQTEPGLKAEAAAPPAAAQPAVAASQPIPAVQRPSAPAPVSVGALEPQGTTACIIEVAANRVCVYRNAGGTIAADDCYPITTTRVKSWVPWLTASDLTNKRIRLVDETGRKRIKVIPDTAAAGGDTVQLRQTDFNALAAKIVPWRTAWVVVQGPNQAVDPGEVGAVRDALQRWRLAWEQKQLEQYAGFYGRAFVPQSDRDVRRWRTHKQYVFEHSGPISVQVEAPSVFVLDPGRTVITTFEQTYRSAAATSRAFKAMRWQRDGDRWQITAETVLQEE